VRSAADGSALWHGQAHMPSVRRTRRVIERGEGAYVWDETGHRLLDLPASLWYCAVGHGRSEIAAAIARQMSRLESYSNFQQYATRPALELADRLAAVAPVRGAKVFLGSGGSDAVETACKLARRYWDVTGRPGKRVIVSRERCYHGLHAFGTSITGLAPNRAGYGTLVPEVATVPHDDWRAFEELVRDLGADRVAAFLCEPVIGTGGVIHPADGYLENVQRVCRENDVLFVVDEVITGFGRTGELFAATRFGLEPDLLLFAKGVTSGYLPLGGVMVSERVAAPFWDDDGAPAFRHGLTYQAHATACAAAHANLDIIDREDLVARVRGLERTLEEALRPLEDHPAVVEVRSGIGLLAGVQLRDADLVGAVVDRCWRAGVLTRPIGDGDTLHVSPPFVITDEEIRRVGDTFAEAISRAYERAGDRRPAGRAA
jgi:adenosylmethionine-8-amino-7-oxononanoate aminotransferase